MLMYSVTHSLTHSVTLITSRASCDAKKQTIWFRRSSLTERSTVDPMGGLWDCSYTQHNHHHIGWKPKDALLILLVLDESKNSVSNVYGPNYQQANKIEEKISCSQDWRRRKVSIKIKPLYHYVKHLVLLWKNLQRDFNSSISSRFLLGFLGEDLWALMAKVPVFKCQKMALWAPESKNGLQKHRETSPKTVG